MKRCCECLEVKPHDDFRRNAQQKDGRHVRCKTCQRPRSAASARKYRRAHPEARYKTQLREVYGLTLEEYQRIRESQGCACAGCGGGQNETLCVDHDHSSGQIRGLLCRRCNMALGLLNDDVDRLCLLTAYLSVPMACAAQK